MRVYPRRGSFGKWCHACVPRLAGLIRARTSRTTRPWHRSFAASSFFVVAVYAMGVGKIPCRRMSGRQGKLLTLRMRNQVPISQEARYFSCSGVKTSIWMPIAANLRRAISLSTFLGQSVHIPAEPFALLDQEFRSQCLIGKTHVHYGGGVTFGGCKVNQAPLSQ